MKLGATCSALLLVPALLACGGDDDQSTSSGVALTGAGATFPYPLYSRWFADYADTTGVRINYQSIGSGGGIRQLSEQTVDFGASDSPMTDEEQSRARGGEVLHIPMVMGAVAVTYNLPGVTQQLRLDGPTLGDVFLGRITKWNDQRIAALNPGVSLPARDILVVHRTDGSGTTFIFTDYLASVSQSWQSGPGRGKDVRWPVGLGGKGNEGVAAQVKQTEGAIGYVELAYANQNRLPVASIRNASGNFVAPSTESVTAAAAGKIQALPPDTDYRISIVNAPGANAYPIASFTWLLVYRDALSAPKGKQIADFIRWALQHGDRQAESLDYAPLPASLDQRLIARLDSLAGAPAGAASQ